MDDNELYHHGILGMKWGVRRFQNSDGSLKPAGEKRYNSGKSLGEVIKSHKVAKQRKKNLEKARKARIEKKAEEINKQKIAEERSKLIAKGKIKIKDMTDSEIANRISRLENEKRLSQLELETDKGKRFVDTIKNKVISPAATSAGEQFLRKFMNNIGDDVLKNIQDAAASKDPGKNQSKRIEKLKNDFTELDYKKKIEDLKKSPKTTAQEIKELEDQINLLNLKDESFQALKRQAQEAEFISKINKAKNNKDSKDNKDDKDGD